MPETVIYDACVLYPASLRSFLMWLGYHDLVHARWTDRILDECFDNLLANRADLDPEDLSRTRELMCEAIPDCLVEDFQHHISELELPDEDDRHVLAAAIEAGASSIVTFNLDDFPNERLQSYDLQAVHPDDFVCELLRTEPDAVMKCLQEEASIRQNPNRSELDVCRSLGERGLDEASNRMKKLLKDID
ncbi:MAG: PIN domain-containing protein [Bradymonadaceae bacterium]